MTRATELTMNLRRNIGGRLVLALCVAAMGLAAGCSSCKPGKSPGKALSYSLKITPGESLKDSSAEVDVIGANADLLAQLQNYSVKKYFKHGDPVRRDAPKLATIKFVPGKQEPYEIPQSDPQWAAWIAAGVHDLVVLADLPEI